jgi:hypothetical protein
VAIAFRSPGCAGTIPDIDPTGARRIAMTEQERSTTVNDLIFLIGFAFAAVVVAAIGRFGSIAGAAITALSLGGLIALGWRCRP